MLVVGDQRPRSAAGLERLAAKQRQPAGSKQKQQKKPRTKAADLRRAERRHADLDRPQDRRPGRRTSQTLNPEVDPQILIAGEMLKLQVSRRRSARCCGVLLALVAAAAGGCGGTPASAKQRRRARRPSAWALIDARTGEVLTSHAAAKNAADRQHDEADDRLRGDEGPAARQDRAGPPLRIRSTASRCSGLRAGQRISVHDLLYGLILLSANDAAHDLAIASAGSETTFVAEMNRTRRRSASPTPTTPTRSGSTSGATTRAPSTWRR